MPPPAWRRCIVGCAVTVAARTGGRSARRRCRAPRFAPHGPQRTRRPRTQAPADRRLLARDVQRCAAHRARQRGDREATPTCARPRRGSSSRRPTPTSARAALLPWVNLLGTGGIKAGGGSDLTSALQGVMLGVSWEPDLWGRLRYGRNAADDSYASAQADFEFARQSLAAQVARSWFARHRDEAAARGRGIDGCVITRARVAGRGPTARRQRQRQGRRARAGRARARWKTPRDRPSSPTQQAVRSLGDPRRPLPGGGARRSRRACPTCRGPSRSGMPLDMLERRPDIIAAERRVAAAFNRVGEAKAARLPTIRLNASIAALSSDVLTAAGRLQQSVAAAPAARCSRLSTRAET